MLLLCADVFTIKDSMQDDPLCMSFIIDEREVLVYVRQVNTLLKPGSNGHLYSLRTSHCLLWGLMQVMCSSGESKVPDTTNVTLFNVKVIKEVERSFGLE